jgi:hypothetical protein
MPDHTGYHLFTAADQPSSVVGSRSEFETRLVHGLLLEPGLVMPDAYFFSSVNLKEHVFENGRGNISLFEAAMKEGLIVPALRQPANSFKEVLRYLRTQQLQGFYDDLDLLASRLSQSRDLDSIQMLWPARMGVRYDELMQLCLHGRPPSGVDSQIWELTDRLRHEAIDEARRITRLRPDGDGLRRGDVIRVAGSILGVFDLADKRVIDRVEVLSRYAGQVGSESVEYCAAKEFFDWIDEIHRVNTARSLGARSSIFASAPDTLAVLQKAMPSASGGDQQQSSNDEIDVVIKIPSVRRLLAWPPDAILDARNFGKDWRAAATIFMEKPSDGTRHQAEKALECYEKALRKFSPTPPRSELSVKVFATKASPGLFTMASSLIPALAFPAVAIAPAIGPCVAAAVGTGYFAYRYLIKGRNDKVRLRVPPGLNIIQPSGS